MFRQLQELFHPMTTTVKAITGHSCQDASPRWVIPVVGAWRFFASFDFGQLILQCGAP